MEEIYIYALIDPITQFIRYIGKTNNLKRRYTKHLTTSKTSKIHSSLWIKSLLNKNEKPIMKLIEIVNTNNWQEREIYWIKYYRTQFDLTNITEGGEGSTTYGFKGRKHTQESIDKMILARTGVSINQNDNNGNRRKAIINYCNQNKKIVYQYNLKGDFIKKWDSAVDAANNLKLIHSNITQCCKNLRNKVGNYIWKYEFFNKIEIIDTQIEKYKELKILLTLYSVKQIAQKLNLTERSIYRQIKKLKEI